MPDGLQLSTKDLWTPTPPETIRQRTSRPTLRAIREIVCGEFRIDEVTLSRGPAPRAYLARRVAMWLAYCHAYDLDEIGHCFGREPATVMAFIARADQAIEANPNLADRVIGLARSIDPVRGS